MASVPGLRSPYDKVGRVVYFGRMLEGKPIETFFDLIEYDEGRDPAASQPWRHLG